MTSTGVSEKESRLMEAGSLHVVVGSGAQPRSLPCGSEVKVLTFNLERGYDPDAAVAFLKTQDADVLLLQELDSGCKRTGSRDVTQFLADGLGMSGVYVVEFEELDSPSRSSRKAGGGVHGNAILTRLPFTQRGVIPHVIEFDWVEHGKADGEPRKGRRVAVWADIVVWQDQEPMRFISAHLENKCGHRGRARQFSELMPLVGEGKPVVVGGDLNTLLHGIVRFDFITQPANSRLLGLGLTEAQWFEKIFFSSASSDQEQSDREKLWLDLLPDVDKSHFQTMTRFRDAFDKSKDCTLDPTTNWTLWFRSFLYNGKLDWLLFTADKMACTAHAVVPSGTSDHCAVSSTLRLL